MSKTILINGAGGYIGGSLMHDFLSRDTSLIKDASLIATYRTEVQAAAFASMGIKAVQVNLINEAATIQCILDNEVDIVIHTAGSVDPRMVRHLIRGLGKRQELSREQTYFIHTSVATVFSEEAGWPYGQVRDTENIYQKEKEMGGTHPVRLTHIATVDEARKHGVTSMIIPVPTAYGRGTGPLRRLSVSIPAYIRTSIEHKLVYKFDQDSRPPGIHISDLTELYALLVEKILRNEPVSSGEHGYYFAVAHSFSWWDVMNRIAASLYARGLVDNPTPHVWPTYEMAAKALGFPVAHIRAMGVSNGDLIPDHGTQLGLRPHWDERRFLESIDDEVQAVLELDTVKPTIFDELR